MVESPKPEKKVNMAAIKAANEVIKISIVYFLILTKENNLNYFNCEALQMAYESSELTCDPHSLV